MKCRLGTFGDGEKAARHVHTNLTNTTLGPVRYKHTEKEMTLPQYRQN